MYSWLSEKKTTNPTAPPFHIWYQWKAPNVVYSYQKELIE